MALTLIMSRRAARCRRGLAGLAGCAAGALLVWTTAAAAVPLGLPPLPIPPDNPQTPEKVQLGDRLFHDTRLSSTGQVGCTSCHLDGIAFHDGRPVPRGVNKLRGTRNAPTVLNAAYLDTQFWDGRAASLEEQALQPLANPVEHGLRSAADVLDLLRRDPQYTALFRAAFGVEAAQIGLPHVGRAIAAYERTLIAGNSPFDRWYYAGEAGAVGDDVKRGFAMFTGAAGCSACHPIGAKSALFTDQRFHNAGVGFARLGADPARAASRFAAAPASVDTRVLSDAQASELGRYAVTGQLADLGAFKTPGLRNVARTAPYLHDGSLNTLEQVVDYFTGGFAAAGANSHLSPLLRPLALSAAQKQDLVAFLKSLTSPEYMPPGNR